ncbi:hypothetical protein JXQ31_19775 [candidate division KSB1 bacterium]|nr:hypothetical protein [candidate division KSB1 bacterium]
MKVLKYLLLMLLIVPLLNGCQKDDSVIGTKDEETKIEFLRFINYGCASEKGLEKTLQNDYYLTGYRLNKDTLTLTIHFPANCCPDFSDSIYVSNNNVNITLADKSPGCFCICEYNNDFTFLYTGGNKIHIIFRFMDFGDEGYTTRIDTLVVLNTGYEPRVVSDITY